MAPGRPPDTRSRRRGGCLSGGIEPLSTALWGDRAKRSVNWEVATALSLLEAGAELLVLRHPETIARMRRIVDEWFK